MAGQEDGTHDVGEVVCISELVVKKKSLLLGGVVAIAIVVAVAVVGVGVEVRVQVGIQVGVQVRLVCHYPLLLSLDYTFFVGYTITITLLTIPITRTTTHNTLQNVMDHPIYYPTFTWSIVVTSLSLNIITKTNDPQATTTTAN